MEKIVFADSWEGYFSDLGLKTFDDFYNYGDAIAVNKNRKRNVQRLTFGTETEPCVFFMKRFHKPHLKDMLAARRACETLVCQAGVEWHNARFLLKNGIGVYQPVCMGRRTRWAVEVDSFFVTKELDAVCLRDFVLDRWQGLDRREQENILIAVANLARTMHQLGIAFPDLTIWHIFFTPQTLPDCCDLSVIDLHRMSRGVRSRRRKVRDLSKLCWSMLPEYFDDDHRRLLLDTYFAGYSPSRREVLKRVIERYETVLNSRHTSQRYYKKIPQFKST